MRIGLTEIRLSRCMAIYSEQKVGKDFADSYSLWLVEKIREYVIIKKNVRLCGAHMMGQFI